MNADQPAVSPVGPALESYCPRSLAATLVGALTMLVLFTAQTWGVRLARESDFTTVVTLAVCQPLAFLHAHVLGAFRAWKMEQRLKKVDGIRYWNSHSLRSLLGAKAWINLAAAPSVERSTSLVAVARSSHPLEIFPQMMLNQSPLHESEGDRATADSLSDQCFLLSDEGKEALLEFGFVPSYEQLRYVKSKSGVEIIIVVVQAAGYLLGILLRMAADQRISPIEALATFLGILMILHALLERFASYAYKRTLLFHLDPLQFLHWNARVERIKARSAHGDPVTWSTSWFLIALTVLLPLVAAIYFAVDFLVPHHRCLICFIPALFFSLNLILLAPLYIALFSTDDDSRLNEYFGTSLFVVLMLLHVSSFVVAVIGTVLEWDNKFNEPTKSWYRWIIPHIGS